MANINDIGFMAFPKELIVGALGADVNPDAIESALIGAGVEAADVHFLQGEEGLRILNPEGEEGTRRQRVTRKVEAVMHEGDVLAILAERIRSGRTLVGVHHVVPADSDRLTAVCAANGVEDIHYLGRWTMH